MFSRKKIDDLSNRVSDLESRLLTTETDLVALRIFIDSHLDDKIISGEFGSDVQSLLKSVSLSIKEISSALKEGRYGR
jgi:hypothetical protein